MSCSTKKNSASQIFWHILYFKEANRLYFDKNYDIVVVVREAGGYLPEIAMQFQ